MMKFRLLFFFLVLSSCGFAQTVTGFDGISASQVSSPGFNVDPNGAVGTKQYMEWVDTYYQAYDKTTFAKVWTSPQNGDQPWVNAGMSNCFGSAGGDGFVTFDHLASRWVIAKRGSSGGNYYYCIAVSNTDDLKSASLTWFTYQFALAGVIGTNSQGHSYWPDWPKLGTWLDAYYVSFDLEDPDNGFQEIGVVACALDRTNMLAGLNTRTMQCFSDPSPIPSNGALYLSHSLIPADFEGTLAPPSGRHEYFVSIQNPVADGVTMTTSSLNLWDFHVDWNTPSKSTFTKTNFAVKVFTPGCYSPGTPSDTFCVVQPSTSSTRTYLDSVGDRVMPHMSYRNFGTYQSFLFSFTSQVVTGVSSNQQTQVKWFEMRGSGRPSIFQSGAINNGTTLFRFMPSISQDKMGNAAAGYSVSSSLTHPSIRGSSWSLPNKTKPVEFNIRNGSGDQQNSSRWGDYSSMTVDPVDDCTFWYVNQYLSADQTGSAIIWKTRISNFKIAGCQ